MYTVAFLAFLTVQLVECPSGCASSVLLYRCAFRCSQNRGCKEMQTALNIIKQITETGEEKWNWKPLCPEGKPEFHGPPRFQPEAGRDPTLQNAAKTKQQKNERHRETLNFTENRRISAGRMNSLAGYKAICITRLWLSLPCESWETGNTGHRDNEAVRLRIVPKCQGMQGCKAI